MSCICQFCDSELSTIYILKHHQKTAKKCLLKQKEMKEMKEIENEINYDVVDIKNYNCKYCNKSYTTFTSLERHRCKVFFNPKESKKKIKELENENSLLEARLNKEIETNKELLLKINSSITTNNYINRSNNNSVNIQNNVRVDNYIKSELLTTLTNSHIESILEKYYDQEWYNKGIDGIINFMIKYLLIDNTGSPLYLSKINSISDFRFKKDGKHNSDKYAEELLAITRTKILNHIEKIHKIKITPIKRELNELFGITIDLEDEISTLSSQNSHIKYRGDSVTDSDKRIFKNNIKKIEELKLQLESSKIEYDNKKEFKYNLNINLKKIKKQFNNNKGITSVLKRKLTEIFVKLEQGEKIENEMINKINYNKIDEIDESKIGKYVSDVEKPYDLETRLIFDDSD